MILREIATTRNSRTEATDDHWGNVVTEIALADDIPTEAFDNIEQFSHLEIIFYFDKVGDADIVYSGRPRGNPDYPMMGIFCQRKKDRPNKIGLCTVELLTHNGRTIIVKGLDAIDGTPVLDIKPVFREFQTKGTIRQPEWVGDLMKNYWHLKTSGYASVNGLEMYYETHGEGDMPLVLIHGGGSTIETTFGKTLPLFSSFGKVIVVELQAHGRTSDRDAPETFEQDADDVAGLLKQLKVDKANILGFSNGGTTTLQIAIRHPHIVNKIIVISANYKREGMIPGFFDGMRHATLSDMPEALKSAYLKVAPDKNGLQVMFEKDVARMIHFKGIDDDHLAAIKVPALLMVADRDVITVEHTVNMSRLIAGAQLVVLPGTHGLLIGAAEAGGKEDNKLPGITVTLVEEFLNG